MIDLEQTQRGIGVAVCESVQSRAEQDVLRYSTLDRLREHVFSVAAAGDEKGAQSN